MQGISINSRNQKRRSGRGCALCAPLPPPLRSTVWTDTPSTRSYRRRFSATPMQQLLGFVMLKCVVICWSDNKPFPVLWYWIFLSMTRDDRSQRESSLRHGSAFARVLWLRARIPPVAGMTVSFVCCEMSEITETVRSLVQRSHIAFRVCLSVILKPR